MSEADTRAQLIDKQLEEVGWVTDKSKNIQVLRECSFTDGEIQANGTRKSAFVPDYLLEYKGRKLAIIEAKSTKKNVNDGITQAKKYASKLQLPVSFATNGKKICQLTFSSSDPEMVLKQDFLTKFPSPEELLAYTSSESNLWLEKFSNVPFKRIPGKKQIRYYQEIAVNKVMKAVSEDEQRILLTLATGTGKTYIAFQIAWKLFESKWNLQKDETRRPRILFLTDRNILADQAILEFGAFESGSLVRILPDEISKEGKVPKNGSIFFTIFQTFMSGGEETPYYMEYEADFFDLIIVDECHRGGASDESTWREILNYFSNSVHLGLTATPKRTDNVDTYNYFGNPVYSYSLKEGILDGFLTPFRIKLIETSIDSYTYVDDDIILEGEVIPDHIYTEAEFNWTIEIEERERKRVQLMLGSMEKDEKTIVFCANQIHAAKIRDLINTEIGIFNIDYCVRVTAEEGAVGDNYLRLFQDNERKIPTILTTSHKLTTGVDARNVRNIVIFRPIKSMIMFKQIIGRGTRLADDKNYFTVLDFVGASKEFMDTEWEGDPIEFEIIEDTVSPKNTKSKIQKKKISDKKVTRIKLSDGSVRSITHSINTLFFFKGNFITAKEFVKQLFNTVSLPDMFNNESELRLIWANPITRRDLMEKLRKAGFNPNELHKLQEIIDVNNCDLFDVLAFISFAKPPLSRKERIERIDDNVYNLLDSKHREFVSYLLQNYVKHGLDELNNLSDSLKAKYGSIQDAERILGPSESIRKTIDEIQLHLYKKAA